MIECGINNGVIKIDFEGFEPLITKSIAEIIPNKLSFCLMFENLDWAADINSLTSFLFVHSK